VLVAPVIPGLTDHELPAILAAAREAGATHAGYAVLRLAPGVREVFLAWLTRHRPHAKAKVVGRLRDLHGGEVDDPRFGTRMCGEGPIADAIRDLFLVGCRRAGLPPEGPTLSSAAFRAPGRLF